MGYLSQFAGKVKTDNKQSGFLSQYSNYNSPENIAKRKKQKEEELKRKQEEQKRAQLQLQPSTSLPTGKSVSQQQLTNKFVSSVPQTYQAQQLQGKGQPVTTEEQRQQQEYQQKTPAIQQSVGKNLKDLAKSSILQISSFLWNAPDVAIKNVLYRDAQNLKIAKNVADVAVNPANAPVVIVKEIAKKLSGNDKKKETGILSELKDKLRTDYENWKSKSSSGQVYTGVQTELKRQQEEAGYKTSDEYNQASLKDKLTKHFGETLLTVLGGTIPSIAPYFVNAGFGQSAMFVNTNQDIYDDAIKGGVDKEKATKLATTTATVISLLDSIVPDEVMGKNVKEKFISGFIKKIANLGLTSGKEAATEITQEIAQMLAEKTYREVTGKEAIDRTVMSGIGGLLGGIGFGGIDLAFNTAADVSQESKPQLETQVEVNKMPQNQDLQQQEVEQQEEAKPPETVKTEEELAREYIKGRATKLREERKYDISWTDKKGKKHKIKDVEYADAQGWVSNLDKQGISPLVTKVSETKYRLEEEPKTEEGDLISEAKKYKSAEEFVKAQGTPVYHGTPNKFETFDINKAGTSTDTGMFGKGIYFSNDINEAKTYSIRGNKVGEVKEVYLDLKNPYVINSKSDIPDIKVPDTTIEDMKNGAKNYSEAFTKYLQDRGYDGVIDEISPNKQYVVFNPEQIKTKSQLEDIWNKANKNVEIETLIQEAKKYKSAEEFIKEQGTPVYHGTSADFEEFSKTSAGMNFFSSSQNVSKTYGSNIKEAYLDLKNPLVIDMKGYDWYGQNIVGKSFQPKFTRKDFSIKEVKGNKHPFFAYKGKNLLDRYDTKAEAENAISGYIRDFTPETKSLNKGRKKDYIRNEALKAKRAGYDGVIFKNVSDLGDFGERDFSSIQDTYVVFDPSKIKTKSQLIDIWNKANKEKYRLKDDFQKATGIDLTDSQEQKIIDLNKKFFGDDDVKITAQILTPSGQKALGSYRDGMIKILDGKADATDTYLHEAVHKYFDIFLTEDEQVNLLLAAKKEFGGKDFAEVEENLAENFIEYAKKKDLDNKEIKTIFDKIISRIKKYFANEKEITKFYNDIIEGKAKKVKEIKETTVKKGTLPVKGTGEVKASKLEARLKGLSDKVKNLSEEEANDLGVGMYEALKNKDQLSKAGEFVKNNPQEALDVITGKKETPKDLLTNAVFVAYTEYAKEQADNGNYEPILRSTSLQATRMGQELQILSKIDPNNPVSIANQVYDIRVKEIQEKNGQNYRKQVNKEKANLKKEIKSEKKSDWTAFIDSIKC